MNTYILDGRTPIAEPDLMKWALWFETADRCVKDTEQGDVIVSTVFLGLDHSPGFPGQRPELFETMIFVGGSSQGDCERYATWEEAEAGHARWVVKVFKPTPISDFLRQ